MARRKKISLVAREVRAQAVGAALEREFPEAKCALNFETPDQLLFATILSAQCTDIRVNLVTPALFKKFPGSREMAKAKLSQVEELVKSINFFRNKSKSLVGAAKLIQEKHGGKLPRTMEELVELPGVGRKTANVVLGDAFGIQLGVVVDTHVKRIAGLLGLTEEDDPVKIEQDLMQVVPKANWTKFSHWLILHGRRTCIARRPKCGECVIRNHCDFGQKEIFS